MTLQNAIVLANSHYHSFYGKNSPLGFMGAVFRAIPKIHEDSFWETWKCFQDLNYGSVYTAFNICKTIIECCGVEYD